MSPHRKPPLPHWQAARGACRWCGAAIRRPDGAPNRRRRWHPDCLAAYLLATRSGEQRRAVWQRDRGQCAACRRRARGPRSRRWHADHVMPLHAVPREAPGALWCWTLANLQTLCTACHAAKTAAEARTRAVLRRAPRSGG